MAMNAILQEWPFYMKFMKQAYGEFHKISYEMTASVRFCLSCDSFELVFVVLKVEIISIENAVLSCISL